MSSIKSGYLCHSLRVLNCATLSKHPFLDVLIERVEHNFKFTIYRKPTIICSYINYYSSHALSIKLATFSGMFLRALKICSDDYLLEEIEFIFSIGRKHKYPDFILDKAYNKALTTFNTDKAISQEKIVRNILVLPYHQCLQSLVHLFKINFNISLVFSYNSTIKNLLIKITPGIEIVVHIYKIPCSTCNSYYVGQTGASFGNKSLAA